MDTFFITVGLLGLIVGSYLNVCILRLHTGRSTTGRSGCMSCLHTLAWYELIPIVSYVYLRGKCRHCGSALSVQYILVEILTALLFALWASITGSLYELIVGFILIALLVVIVVYDIRHTIIPDKVVYMAVSASLALHVPEFFADITSVLHVVLGVIVTVLPLFVLWMISRGAWMGFGDVKLAMVLGAVLGAYGGFMSVLWGFIIGAVVGVLLLAIHRFRFGNATMNTEIPFAPFLVAGFFLVWFFGVDIITLTEHIMMIL